MLHITEHDENLLQVTISQLLDCGGGIQQGMSLTAIMAALNKNFSLKMKLDKPEVIKDTAALNKLLLKYFQFEYGVYRSASCCRG